MRKLFAALLLSAFFFQTPALAQTDILIKNVNLIHPQKADIQKKVSVYISEGIIKGIGKINEKKLPAPAEIINGEGKFLMHGLMDAHVHFFQSGGLYTRPDALDLRNRVPYEQEQQWLDDHVEDLMKRYTAAGITHLCDVGGPMKNYETRNQADKLDFAPKLFVTGPLISTYQPEAFKLEDAPIVKINTPEEARALVQKQLPHKPDFIKIWYIVGRGQTAESNLPIIEATIDESHKAGVKVAVHATQLETARLAVKAGADILVHSVDDKEVDQEFIKLMVAHKVSYIPTLIVSNNYDKVFSQQYPITPEDFTYANPHTLGTLMDLRHIPDKELPSYISSLRQQPYRARKNEALMGRNLKKLIEEGVNVVVGTDAGNIGTLHASSYYAELDAMKAAGISNAEILRAATVSGGNMMGNPKLGIVEEGTPANLILLTKNPFEELATLKKPELVILRGKKFEPKDLISQSPEDLAQRQLNAYNARDIEAFLECYHPEVKVYAYPEKLNYSGRENMRPGYSDMFENTPGLHCELVNRIVTGNTVIDQELVTGFANGRVIKAVAIYTVEDGLITEVRFIQ